MHGGSKCTLNFTQFYKYTIGHVESELLKHKSMTQAYTVLYFSMSIVASAQLFRVFHEYSLFKAC